MLLEAGEHRPLLYSGRGCGNIVTCNRTVGYVITHGLTREQGGQNQEVPSGFS